MGNVRGAAHSDDRREATQMKAYTIRGSGKTNLIYDKTYVPETDISSIIRFELFKATAEEEARVPQKVIATPMAKKYCAKP